MTIMSNNVVVMNIIMLHDIDKTKLNIRIF